MNDDNLYTWNDFVKIKTTAPSRYFPGQLAVICGMEKVHTKRLSEEFNLNIGEWLYTVEFGDGSSIEVPECYLEPYSEKSNK